MRAVSKPLYSRLSNRNVARPAAYFVASTRVEQLSSGYGSTFSLCDESRAIEELRGRVRGAGKTEPSSFFHDPRKEKAENGQTFEINAPYSCASYGGYN